MVINFLAYSDTDSEWSSLERRQRASEVYSKVNRKSGTHKRQRKKRTAIPVQPPRVPQLGGFTLPSVHSTPHVELDADKANGEYMHVLGCASGLRYVFQLEANQIPTRRKGAMPSKHERELQTAAIDSPKSDLSA